MTNRKISSEDKYVIVSKKELIELVKSKKKGDKTYVHTSDEILKMMQNYWICKHIYKNKDDKDDFCNDWKRKSQSLDEARDPHFPTAFHANANRQKNPWFFAFGHGAEYFTSVMPKRIQLLENENIILLCHSGCTSETNWDKIVLNACTLNKKAFLYHLRDLELDQLGSSEICVFSASDHVPNLKISFDFFHNDMKDEPSVYHYKTETRIPKMGLYLFPISPRRSNSQQNYQKYKHSIFNYSSFSDYHQNKQTSFHCTDLMVYPWTTRYRNQKYRFNPCFAQYRQKNKKIKKEIKKRPNTCYSLADIIYALRNVRNNDWLLVCAMCRSLGRTSKRHVHADITSGVSLRHFIEHFFKK